MKILIVSQNFYPEEFKINEIVKDLVKRGHEVTVLTGLPNYPTGKIPREYRFFKNRRHEYFGAKVIRTLEIARRNNAIGLSLNYLSFMISGTLKAFFMKKDFDIVYVYEVSPVTMILPGIIVSKMAKVPLFVYCLDLWPESLKTMLDENNFIYKIMRKFSGWLYRRANKIAVTSKPFINYFKEIHNIDERKLVYLPQHSENIVDKIEFEDNENIDFVYTGNIGRVQGIETLIEASKLIDYENFKIHIVGDGSNFDAIKKLVEESNLKNKILLYGRKPIQEMETFNRLADVFYLSLNSESWIGETLPAKLQGYMGAGKPILAAIDGSAKEIIEESNSGIVSPFGNAKLLSNSMKKFIEMNTDERKELGENAKNYALNNFEKNQVISKLENELYKLID